MHIAKTPCAIQLHTVRTGPPVINPNGMTKYTETTVPIAEYPCENDMRAVSDLSSLLFYIGFTLSYYGFPFIMLLRLISVALSTSGRKVVSL